MTTLLPLDLDALTLPTENARGQVATPVDAYLASLQSANSQVTMRKQLDALAQLIGAPDRYAVPWQQLRIEHTQAIKARVAQTRAAATANLMLSALRGVLKMCWRMNLMSSDAYHRAVDLGTVKGEQPDAAAGRSLSRAELSALFHACADDPRPAGRRDAAILALGYAAGGLRRAEIVALDLADFNPTTAMLTIHGKGNKTRTAYVSGSTRAALDDWLDVRGPEPGPLFIRYQTGGGVGQARDRLSEQAIYKMYKARAEQAGVADFSPHDVRRSFISDSLDAGVDVLTVSRLAGHADPKTTSRYDRRGERAKRQAADAIHVPYRRRDER